MPKSGPQNRISSEMIVDVQYGTEANTRKAAELVQYWRWPFMKNDHGVQKINAYDVKKCLRNRIGWMLNVDDGGSQDGKQEANFLR